MTKYNQNFNNLVNSTLLEEQQQQQIKAEMENKTNEKNILNMGESAKSQDIF